jgi:exodeoxyribonuclease VII large subunit
MQDLINRRQQRIDEFVYRLALAARDALRVNFQRLEAAAARIRRHDPRHQLAELRQALQAQTGALTAATHATLFRRRARLQQLTTHLQALSPLQVLERGYALVFDAAGNLVRESAQVSPKENIRVRLARGTISATVKKREE